MRKLKKLIFKFFILVDIFVPIFPKDSLYRFRFNSNKCEALAVNKRTLGMQYWCDLSDDKFISRYSVYLGQKKSGILIHHWPSFQFLSEIPLDDETNFCHKIIFGELFCIKKINGRGFELISAEDCTVYANFEEPWFDVFSWKNKTFLISGPTIFSIRKNKSTEKKKFCLQYVTYLEVARGKGEGSVCNYKDKLFFVFREFGARGSALNAKLVLMKSEDMSSWLPAEEFNAMTKILASKFDGVGFPTLRVIDGELILFFTGYWGKHLLASKTKKAWQF